MMAASKAPALILSNSSSILPNKIGTDVLGFHFFHPVSLSTFAEAIIPSGISKESVDRLEAFARMIGIKFVVENEASAFAANRLLLPIQFESIKLLKSGIDPRIIDASSISPLMPEGTLSLLDSIGLDTVLLAVQNFRGFAEGSKQYQLATIESKLRSMIDKGALGIKSGKGFICHLPKIDTMPDPKIQKHLFDIFRNTCIEFIDEEILTRDVLNMILHGAFGVEDGVAF